MIAPRTPWSCVLPADTASTLAPVIAAVSFDHQGSQCLRQACQRAAHTGQPVIALHVVYESGRTIGLYHRHDSRPGLMPIADIAKQMLAEEVAECVGSDPAYKTVEIRQLALAGLPGKRIPEVAELIGAELIVIGDGPRQGLTRLLSSNSVTRTVMRRAPCAVLVIDDTGNTIDAQTPPPRQGNRSYPSMLQTP
jgi:nucleotide-binding universal stress UspA family protein